MLNSFKTQTLAVFIGIALSPLSPANVSPCSAKTPANPPKRAVIQQPTHTFVALSDGVVLESRYRAGDITAPGRPLISLTSLEIENRVMDFQSKLSELNLKRLDERNKSIVNTATMDDYTARYGSVTPDMKRRILRQDELRILDQNIHQLQSNIGQLQQLKQKANGIFQSPVLLLSDPPRASETVKAGSSLFRYVFLDQLVVSTYASSAREPSPPTIHVALGKRCMPLKYVYSVIEPKTQSVERIYQGRVDASLSAAVASQIRSPQAYLNVY